MCRLVSRAPAGDDADFAVDRGVLPDEDLDALESSYLVGIRRDHPVEHLVHYVRRLVDEFLHIASYQTANRVKMFVVNNWGG